MNDTITIKNVKIDGFTEKAARLIFKRDRSTRNVWLALSQIQMGDTHSGVTDKIAVARWIFHTSVGPLLSDGWVAPFEVETAPATVQNNSTVADGTYTVVFNNDLDNYRTLCVKTSRTRKDFRIVSYLYGCDNSNDFKGFASPVGNGLRFWKSFDCTPQTKMNLQSAWEVIAQNPQAAGEAYAMRSGNCYNCRRKLTVPTSLHRGLGPDCARKLGAL